MEMDDRPIDRPTTSPCEVGSTALVIDDVVRFSVVGPSMLIISQGLL